ncbi:MAG: integrase core domain-containing protein, partial [Phycisphaeraceae bacterium]
RGLPVVVGFGLTERYPGTNLRHKTFLLQGLQNVAAGLERRGICFVVRLGEPDDVAVELAATAALAQAREEAERIHGPLDKPPFIVPDNGPSFTAKRFVRYTRERFSHVRIAYRTPTQLGLLERLHRTLKREEVYWRLYDSPSEARQCQADFRERYDTRRPHWALVPEEGGDPLTPEDVYTRGMKGRLPAWQP